MRNWLTKLTLSLLTEKCAKWTIDGRCPIPEHSNANYGTKSLFISFLQQLLDGSILEHVVLCVIANDFGWNGDSAGGVFNFSAQPAELARGRTR